MDFTSLTICGVSLPLLIQIAIGLAKKLGFPTAYCPHLSAGLGIIGGIGVALIGGQPIYYGVVAGVMLGGLACGIYDASAGKKDDVNATS